MKKQYIKPLEKETSLFSPYCVLTISGGGTEESGTGEANGRRGKWGDFWGEGEE